MNKFDQKFRNKKIVLLGLGLENLSLLKFLLSRKISCQITVADPSSSTEFKKRLKTLPQESGIKGLECLEIRNDKNYDRGLSEFDLILRSPGYPLFSQALEKARKSGVEISSPMKVFLKFCPTRNTIGVTGTKGKGTTSSLIFHILKRAGKKVFLGGNIGVAPFDFFSDLDRSSWVVLELSSFQLEDMEISPRIAVFLNFYKEHLKASDPHNPNYHKTLKDYWRAKLNIIKNQNRSDKAIVNEKIKLPIISSSFSSELFFFSKSDLESKLLGEHNLENIGAAQKVAELVNIKEEKIRNSVLSFEGLEHRLELVKKDKNNISYFNDSFATTPDSTITALKSFQSLIILLAGGADKGSDFKELASEVKKRCKVVILFEGEASPRIKKSLIRTSFPESGIKEVKSMKEAVRVANQEVGPQEIVLLSPACASFGLFKNYKQRGEMFKKEVKKQKTNVKN